MIPTLEARLRALGRMRRISGNTPILLDNPDTAWYILSGSAQVFAVQIEEDRLVGPKTHFFSAQKGDLLLGMDLEISAGQGFQAVGFPNTQILEIGLGHLKNLCLEPAYTGQMARMIDGWVTGLSKGMTRDIIPRPRPDILLTPGKEVDADTDAIASPEETPVWIDCVSGLSLFIGMETFSPEDGLLPLCKDSWVRMLKGTLLKSLTTREAMAEGQIFQFLTQFHDLIFQILILNTGLNNADRHNLVREKAVQDQKTREKGLAGLASVLSKPATPHHFQESTDTPLVTVCRLVGAPLGISIKEPAQSLQDHGSFGSTIQEVAKTSGINTRQVMLRLEWWKQDQGPLVGFMEEDNRPVALIPCSATEYKLVDPSKGLSKKVSEQTAQLLSPAAFTFYRSFPDHPLKAKDLIIFGLKGCSKDIKLLLILACFIGIISLIPPLATDLIFSDIIPGAQRTRLLNIMVILVCFGITTALFEIARNIGILRVEQRLHYFLESALWDRILRLPIPFFKKFTAGDLATRGMGMNSIRQMVSGPVTTSIIGSIFALFNVILLFYYHTNLALVAVGLLITAVVLISLLGRVQLSYFRPVTHMEGKISGRVLQFLSSLTKLRICGAEDRAFSLWAKDFSRQKKLAYKGGIMENLLMTFNSSFLLLSMMVLFSWLIFQEKGSGLTTGNFLAFNAAYGNLHAAVFQIVISLNTAIMAIPYYERLAPILESVPEVNTAKTDPGKLVGKVELFQIFFRYTKDGPLILKNVSLCVEPGEFVAIVGASGSGKSTLLRLLLGFETPETGTLFYDDQDLSELDVTRVRQNMGVVLQGGKIMAGDIFQNIIGNHPLTLDDAWDAASRASLDKDIRDMPMGMNTVIMEGGSSLSGGQQQRLMIARAVVNHPGILIFDEATSSLDNQTQADVIKSLKKLASTRIVVAHRLSTIRDADRILVMDQGEIRETGTYDELMAKGGLFKKIAQRQII